MRQSEQRRQGCLHYPDRVTPLWYVVVFADSVPNLIRSLDLTVLPEKAPRLLLSAPTPTTPAFLAVAITFSFLFLISFTLISFRHKMGKLQATFEKPMIQRLSAWVGFFGFLIGKIYLDYQGLAHTSSVGMTSFLIIRMWFGKAVQDFNTSIISQGSQGPKLLANTGNAFTSTFRYPLFNFAKLTFRQQ